MPKMTMQQYLEQCLDAVLQRYAKEKAAKANSTMVMSEEYSLVEKKKGEEGTIYI